MNIKTAIFIKGINGSDEILKEEKTHLAFYGRSNVGKSSVINAILDRKNLVKSSSKPGATKELNFFLINDNFFIVDLPGYGYAKVSQKMREHLRRLTLWYIFDSGIESRINIIVLDAKVGLTEYDKDLVEFFIERGEKILILLNKIDKLNQKEKNWQLKKIEEEVSGYEIPVLSFSALKRKGIEKFWNILSK